MRELKEHELLLVGGGIEDLTTPGSSGSGSGGFADAPVAAGGAAEAGPPAGSTSGEGMSFSDGVKYGGLVGAGAGLAAGNSTAGGLLGSALGGAAVVIGNGIGGLMFGAPNPNDFPPRTPSPPSSPRRSGKAIPIHA